MTACSDASQEPGDSTTAAPDSETTSPTSPSTTSVPRPSLVPSTQPEIPAGVFVSDDIVSAALQQAAADAGAAPEDFEVVSALQVTWNDGSLGCPQEGQSYTQALVDGFWVILTDGSETYDYRSAMDTSFRLCANGAPPVTSYVDR